MAEKYNDWRQKVGISTLQQDIDKKEYDKRFEQINWGKCKCKKRKKKT